MTRIDPRFLAESETGPDVVRAKSKSQISQGGKRWKVSRKTKREREEFLFCRSV